MELDEDKEVVVAAADEGRDKVQAGWAVQPPDQAVTVSARPVDIANRTALGCPAPAGLALSVARE